LATSAFPLQAEWTTSWKFTANPPYGIGSEDRFAMNAAGVLGHHLDRPAASFIRQYRCVPR
jgi:hypothetical protein